MHQEAIRTLNAAENKFIQKSWILKYVFTVKSINFLVYKYQDIGSIADSQAKCDLYLLIMMLERFPIVYLSL